MGEFKPVCRLQGIEILLFLIHHALPGTRHFCRNNIVHRNPIVTKDIILRAKTVTTATANCAAIILELQIEARPRQNLYRRIPRTIAGQDPTRYSPADLQLR